MSFYVHRVLEHDAPKWLAAGWREVGRTYPQSLHCADVMIRGDGDELPEIGDHDRLEEKESA